MELWDRYRGAANLLCFKHIICGLRLNITDYQWLSKAQHRGYFKSHKARLNQIYDHLIQIETHLTPGRPARKNLRERGAKHLGNYWVSGTKLERALSFSYSYDNPRCIIHIDLTNLNITYPEEKFHQFYHFKRLMPLIDDFIIDYQFFQTYA